jgi:4-amino-4-deoxy-L-arabinose transferase-like glycosyltransferase
LTGQRRWVVAVVAVALAVRVAVIFATPAYQAVTDAAEFDYIGTTIADHGRYPSSGLAARGGPTAFRPPLFPIALAAVYKLAGTSDAKARWTAARVVEAIFGSVTVLEICLIGFVLWDRRVGLVAGGIAAVYPPLVLVGSSILSESLFIPLLLASVLAALKARGSPRRLRWAILGGLLIGLADLTRSNGFALAIPLAFLVWDQRPRLSLRSAQAPLALLAAFLVTLLPWTVRDISVFNQFVPVTTEGGFGLAGQYNAAVQARTKDPDLWTPPAPQLRAEFAAHPGYNEAQVSNALGSQAITYIENHPSSVLKASYWNALRLLNLTGPRLERDFAYGEGYPPGLAVASVYTFWIVLGLAIAGAFTTAIRRAPLALWGCPALVLLTTMVLLGLTRYRSPADPFFLLAATLGALSLASRAGSTLAARARPRVVA